MPKPATWNPTDRNGPGDQWDVDRVADLVVFNECMWPVEVTATIMAESGGFTWIRPIVNDADSPAHLSTDRGICQFNSYWWGTQALIVHGPDDWRYVSDFAAFHPPTAIARMCRAADAGMLGYWHGYGSENYRGWLPQAERAVRAAHR